MKMSEDTPECDFDEERNLKEFDTSGAITYQFLLELAENMCKLINAWKERLAAAEEVGLNHDSLNPREKFSHDEVGLNLYQLDAQNRHKLQNYSVKRFLQIFGGKEVIVMFETGVGKIVKFLKNTLLALLESCLPPLLPYPVQSITLSNMLAVKGLDKIGLVTKESRLFDEFVWSGCLELKHMDRLHHSEENYVRN